MFKVDDLKEVFELATTAGTFINELMKIKSNCKDTNKDNAKIKSSGDFVSAHGRTVKQAYRDWLFKASPRDMSEYEGLKLEDVRDLNYWAVCYRTITGACALGTENFIETFKDSLKPQMTLQEVISVTAGQYGHISFKEFFERTGNE